MDRHELVLRTAPRSTARVAPAYQVLEGSEIRLLKVRLGSWNDPVSCTLYHIPLDERPQYVALSYTWGNPNKRFEIFLNGEAHCVTRSLFKALRRFRRLCSKRRSFDDFTFCERLYLWADALCIDQENDREKETEIPRMREIYTLSTRVCAWLGGDERKDYWATLELERLLQWDWYRDRMADLLSERFDSKPKYEFVKDIGQKIKGMLDADFDNVLDVSFDLAERNWFYRVWAIQEAALPEAEPILMAGRFLFRFDCFTALCYMFLPLLPREKRSLGPLDQLVSLLNGRVRLHRQQTAIEEDLDNCRGKFGQAFEKAIVGWAGGHFKATKEHDYIYGMLGLCGKNGTIPPALAPNYTKPFPQVCKDYARWIISSTGSVAILEREPSEPPDDLKELWEDMPSWVPDFSAGQVEVEVGHSDPSAVSFTGPEGGLLRIRGLKIGEVAAVYLPLEKREDDTSTEDEEEENYNDDEYDFSDHLRHHHEFLQKVARKRKTQTIDEVVNWLTHHIQSHEESARSTEPTAQDLLNMYQHYYRLYQDGSTILPSHPDYDLDVCKTFMRLARRVLLSARILCLSTVYQYLEIGRRVQPPVQSGDCLVLLSDRSRPSILRPVPTTEGPGYVLLGFCEVWNQGTKGGETLTYDVREFCFESHRAEGKFEDFIIA